MRLSVRSTYTNIHGGYEESSTHDGRPAFTRAQGGVWIFHTRSAGEGPRWHFGPGLPEDGLPRAVVFFSSENDAELPSQARWSDTHVKSVVQIHADRPRSDFQRTLFVDKAFPPISRSIGEVPKLPPVEWVPVRCLREGQMKLFDGDISPNDLLQGAIGNCWLVAAMASLAEFPSAVRSIFSADELAPDGQCELRLFDKRCQTTRVVVDEFIPCHKREWWDQEGTPLFARPNSNEAWVLLAEKAFAKMLGSYRELSGGNCCMAFRTFTGERDTFVWARSEGESARVDGEWKKMRLADFAFLVP